MKGGHVQPITTSALVRREKRSKGNWEHEKHTVLGSSIRGIRIASHLNGSFAVIENAFDSIMDPSCVTQSWISGFQLNYGLSLELNHRIIDPATKHGAGQNFHCVVSA